MGIPLYRWVVSFNITRALSNARMPHQTHQQQQLSDTVQFKHKNITNPLLTHADKIMRALSHCIQALKGMEATTTEKELRDIRQLIDVTQVHLQSNKAALPRVQPQKKPTEHYNQSAPKVHADTVLRVTATTATLQPSIAEVQPPRGTQKRGKQKDIKTSKAASDLT